MCMEFEEGIGNEDKNFEQCLTILSTLIKDVWSANVFSENETFKDIDPQNLCYFLIPYYMAETTFRIMADWKQNIQKAK